MYLFIIMKIAIPSYNRPRQIVDKTLAFLERHNIPKTDIYIFIVDEEHGIYTDSIDNDEYNIIIGHHGIANQRNFITNYFELDEYVLCIDDDIHDLLFTDNGILKSVGDLKFILNNMKDVMESTGLNLCGIYPVANPLFMRSGKLTTDLKFCVGQFYMIKNKKILLNELAEAKEDYENTIKYFINDGGVCRFNNLCVKTVNHAKGGLGSIKTKRLQMNVNATEYLMNEYPEFVFHKKKLGEIRLQLS